MRLLFSERAWDDYLHWQAQDEKIHERLNILIREASRTPFLGIGKPEPLRGNLSGWCQDGSRRSTGWCIGCGMGWWRLRSAGITIDTIQKLECAIIATCRRSEWYNSKSREMKFDPEIHESQLPSIVDYFVNIFEWSELERRADGLHRRIRENPLLKELISSRYEVELSAFALKRRMQLGKRLSIQEFYAHQKFFNFAAACKALATQAPGSIHNRLRAQFMKAKNQELGFMPFLFELSTGVHFSKLGWNIEFVDFVSEHAPDILLTKGAKRIEVECKCLSVDSGRQIHQRDFVHLATSVKTSVSKLAKFQQGRVFISVEFPKRPSVDVNSLSSLNDAIYNYRGQENEVFLVDGTAIRFSNSADHFRADSSLFFHKFGDSEVFVSFSSRQPDQVVHTLLKRLLSDSKRQFTKLMPGILVINIQDALDQEIRELKAAEHPQGSGLQHIATELLNRRPHLIGLSFAGQTQLNRSKSEAGLHSSSGLSYNFFNMSSEINVEKILQEELQLVD